MNTETKTGPLGQASVAGLEDLLGDLKKNWAWMFAVGVLFVLMGVIGLYMAVALTLVSVLLFGALLLMGGVFQLVDAFKCKGWKSIVLYAFIALLYIAAGIAVMFNPVGASVILTAVLAWMLIAIGVLRMVMAFQLRGAKGWGWPLVGGIVSMVLGIMILLQWPVSGLWIIGLFVALEMMIHGWSLILIGWAARKVGKAEPETPHTGAAPA